VLKMGFFGLFRYIILSFTQFLNWYIGLIDTFIIYGLFVLSLNTLFCCDYKKLIAHWSVIHTCSGLILAFHNDLVFSSVVIICNLGHIFSSFMMFYMIGFMYDQTGVRVILLLATCFSLSLWSSLFFSIFLFNIDFPFMLLFIVELLICYGFSLFSSIYLIIFFFIGIIMFLTSIYIYVVLSYFSFSWINKNIKLDLSINDILIVTIVGLIVLKLFFLLYILF
jgi:NADH:ubiquinone oxidoreductase subunit 4 (subunit M)